MLLELSGHDVHQAHDGLDAVTGDFVVAKVIVRDKYDTRDKKNIFGRIVEIDKHRSLLAGHFPIQKYLPYYPIHQVITIVRDPVQRALSHWYDLQRRIDYTDSLETFIEEFSNILQRQGGAAV